MSESHKKPWINSFLLLGALAAGMFTTQFVPAYQEHVGKVTYPSRAAAKSEAPSDSSRGYSKLENSDPQITLVRHVE
jgi:hypothetical protein